MNSYEGQTLRKGALAAAVLPALRRDALPPTIGTRPYLVAQSPRFFELFI